MYCEHKGFSICYDKAIRKDGSLFFPKKLHQEFLDEQRKVLGTYIFYNQYLNEIIPEGEQEFKRTWLKYYDKLPDRYQTFAFIDPAISQSETADYTALVIVHVSEDNDWYLEIAKRQRITATDTIRLMFKVNELFKPSVIGVEVVAYQQALVHFLSDEMRKRKVVIPVHPLKRGNDKTKEMRIRGLLPRFEWGRIFIKKGLRDFEDEYSKFPKAQHDDIMDALASIEEITYPKQKERKVERVPTPQSSNYESHYIRQLTKKVSEDY